MKVVIQRVNNANVVVNKEIVGEIEKGLVVLLGISNEDTENTVEQMVNKISKLRIFSDENDKMNLSIKDIDGKMLIILCMLIVKVGIDQVFQKQESQSMQIDYMNILFQKYINNKLVLNMEFLGQI